MPPKSSTQARAAAANAAARRQAAVERGRKGAETRRQNAAAAAAAAASAAEDGNREGSSTARRVSFDLQNDGSEDDTPVTHSQLRSLSDNVSGSLSTYDARFDALEDKLARVLARLDGSEDQMAPTLAGVSGMGVPLPFTPMRGQHGECPPITVRYAYIDEKLRGEAMAGTLGPDKLPSLLPDTSPLSSAVVDTHEEFTIGRSTDGTDRLVYKSAKKNSGQVHVKFVKAIPSPTVFAAAWGIFTDLVLHGLAAHDAKTVADAHSALRHHEFWVLERARDFTWDSICAYHLAVAAERLASGFRCELWYRNVDADLWTRLQRRKDVPAIRPASSTPSSLPESSRRAHASMVAARAPVCNNFNMGTCKEPACRRRHVCKKCEGEGHTAGTCKAR